MQGGMGGRGLPNAGMGIQRGNPYSGMSTLPSAPSWNPVQHQATGMDGKDLWGNPVGGGASPTLDLGAIRNQWGSGAGAIPQQPWQSNANVQSMFPGMGIAQRPQPMPRPQMSTPSYQSAPASMMPASAVPPANPNGPQYGSPLNPQNPLWDQFASQIGNPATRMQGLQAYRAALDAQRMPIGSEGGGGEYAPINLTRRY
jgi:hypothetical protein